MQPSVTQSPETPAPAPPPACRTCPECGARFALKRGQWRTLFCGPAHRTAWHNRATVRGRVLTPLVMAERETRGGTRGDTETGKAARRMACALMQQWKEEDKAAGRMSQAQYVRLRLKLGFD